MIEVDIPAVAADDVLELPKRKSMVVQYAVNDDGARELRLFYGAKEISFDEPELFAFGETLAAQTRFRAGDAVRWGDGYRWPELRDLFQTLLEEGILRRAGDGSIGNEHTGDRARPSPLPPATCARPRAWREAEDITRELAGRAVEPGYLEVFVPIFRVAHIAVDADGRHVGEANVFPRALRTETPTEWMSCIYGGTRYMADAPMNVTALKAMRAHWPQMMAALRRIRAAFLTRCPEAENGWTIGRIERLATAVLCVPSYQLARCDGPVENGDLHPALSSLFRVTDGLRMVMHEMLFVPIGEPAMSPDDPTTVEQIHEYAERNYSFHSETGVCAGPRHMVREFLEVLIDGDKADLYDFFAFDRDVDAALADVDAAMDYAFLGLRTYAATFSFWPLMARVYESLATIAQLAAADGAEGFVAFDRRMSPHLQGLKGSHYLAHESWRDDRDRVYADMYAQCGRGVSGARPDLDLPARLAPVRNENVAAVEAELRRLLMRRLCAKDRDRPHVEALVACLMDFVMRTQAILRTATTTQSDINRLLKRDEPARRLNAHDIDVYHLVQGPDPSRLPFLLDEIEATLGVRFEIDSEHIEVGERA
jgi:hypothetical protein